MIAGRPVYVPSPPELITGGYHSVYLPEEAERSDLSKIGAVDYRTMSIDDIRMVIEPFAVAAARAQRAGLDDVELHGGHDYRSEVLRVWRTGVSALRTRLVTINYIK